MRRGKLTVRAGENVTVSFGGNLQTNYYFSPAMDQQLPPVRIIYRNYYPTYESGSYPSYSSGSYSGPSQPAWVPIAPHRPLSD